MSKYRWLQRMASLKDKRQTGEDVIALALPRIFWVTLVFMPLPGDSIC